MNEYEIHETILKQVCREIEDIAEQIDKSGSMSEKDLERLDKLYHIKKSMLTAKAMTDAEEYSEGMSGARGRSAMTGRYVSREGGNSGYSEGYSQGYSQAMSQMMNSGYNNGGNSGHYVPPYYPEQRRW